MKRANAAALVAMLLFAGCRQQPPPPPAVAEHAERGPLRMTVSASPPAVWVGDPIQAAVEVHAPADYRIQLPDATSLAELATRQWRVEEPRPTDDGGLTWRATFVIDTERSGTLEIPPLTARYAPTDPADSQPAGDFEYELVTASIKIEVRSALTSQDTVSQPRDITGALLPPRRLSPGEWALLEAAGLAVVLAGWWLYALLRRRALRPAPQLSPEDWALAALRALSAGDWFQPGAVREFYYGLSEIVRQYIERKFGLAAPEMTTEEFLQKLARDRRALPYDAGRLAIFLETCDLVKYAALAPAREDAELSLSAARGFIAATARAANEAVAGAESAERGQAA